MIDIKELSYSFGFFSQTTVISNFSPVKANINRKNGKEGSGD